MPGKRGSLADRLRWNTDVRGDDECWLWRGHLDKDGYGQLRCQRADGSWTFRKPHAIALELAQGSPIADGAFVLHRCNTPACVNPRHLYEGDHVQNMRDRKAAGNYASGDAHWTRVQKSSPYQRRKEKLA